MDYGVLLTENREFVASAAWMFDTDIVPLSRLRLQWGPQADLAWLRTGNKTDVFALSLGASARSFHALRFQCPQCGCDRQHQAALLAGQQGESMFFVETLRGGVLGIH
jgi:hypothetical protein